jgi:alkylation response protein AidB-like acyl-CoA dehydrogenase
VGRVYRDLRVLGIYEGASEIHRNIIAKQLPA